MLVQHLQAAWWITTSAFITYYRLLNTDHTTAYSWFLKYDISSIPLHTPHAYRPLITPCLLAQYNIYNSQYGKYISQNFVCNSSLTNIPAIHTYMYVTPSLQIFSNPSSLFKSHYLCPSNSTQYGTHADLNSTIKAACNCTGRFYCITFTLTTA